MRTGLPRRARLLAGGGLVVAGFYLLWTCYEGSGRKKPIWMGPFAPW